jgi:hypothetical protein
MAGSRCPHVQPQCHRTRSRIGSLDAAHGIRSHSARFYENPIFCRRTAVSRWSSSEDRGRGNLHLQKNVEKRFSQIKSDLEHIDNRMGLFTATPRLPPSSPAWSARSPAGTPTKGWRDGSGIAGWLASESAAGFAKNTQQSRLPMEIAIRTGCCALNDRQSNTIEQRGDYR